MRERVVVAAVIGGVALSAAGCGDATQSTANESTAPPAATPTPPTTPGKRARKYETLDDALDAIAQRVDVPVVFPKKLPPNMRLAMDPVFANGGAQLMLRGGRRNLLIQYGGAGFDGCGPTDPRVVKVGNHDAVVQEHRRGKRPYTTVVWPATPNRPVGRYGLSGDFDRAQMLRFAATMGEAGAPGASGERTGC